MKEKVLKYLTENKNGGTPTQIGLALGKDYNSASSSVSGALKSLLKDSLVEKLKIDGKLIYRIR